jgi:hypothetical protein
LEDHVTYNEERDKHRRDVEVMGPGGPQILSSPDQRSGDILGEEIAQTLIARERVGENIMVSPRRHVAPPEAYRGKT